MPALIVGGLLLGIGMLGVHARNKRRVPRLSFWAWVLFAIGFTAGGPFVWGLNVIGAPALAIGGVLMGVATLRGGSLPRVAGWLLVTAAPGGALVQMLAAAIEGEGSSLLSFAGPATYVLCTLVGALWLALSMPISRVEPLDGGPSPTAA
jgi:fucose permease